MPIHLSHQVTRFSVSGQPVDGLSCQVSSRRQLAMVRSGRSPVVLDPQEKWVMETSPNTSNGYEEKGKNSELYSGPKMPTSGVGSTPSLLCDLEQVTYLLCCSAFLFLK